VILGTSQNEVENSAQRLFKANSDVDLTFNQPKIKYMVMSRHEISNNNPKVDGYSFEQVEEFKHLGVNIHDKNNMHNEIKLRMSAANRNHYATKEMLLYRINVTFNIDVHRTENNRERY